MPFSNPLFATNSRIPYSKIPQITASFGRPSNRRNSLRKKLTHDLQVRQNPPNIVDPLHDFMKNEASGHNLGLEQGRGIMGTQVINSESSNFENFEQLGDSPMRSKLDTWVEQYKKDIEFWGIGSNPIFTVFRDSSGNAERVFVDEDEILRRSGVEPLRFREERELEDFGEVNSKIAHAKFLAREMELGKDMISKNSSIVKFESKGENLGFVSKIRSASVPRNLLPKYSWVGIAMVCGLFFVWTAKKLFTLEGDETEEKRFQKEMLRRKIKARMEKDKLQKGRVEVVEEPSEQVIDFMERPCLNNEKVLSSIRKAKGLNNELHMLNSTGTQDIASVNLERKIKEIQMMARHARKIEREEHSDIEADKLDEQAVSELAKMEDLTEVPVNSVNDGTFKIQVSNELPTIEKDTDRNKVEDHTNMTDEFSDESFTKPRFVNGITRTEILENKESESECTSFTSEKVFEGNEGLVPESSTSGRISDHDNSQMHSLVKNHKTVYFPPSTDGFMSSEVSSSGQGSPKEVPGRRRPKIILSVKEAREYLLEKHDQKPQVGESLVTVKNGLENHTRLGEDGKAPESSSVDQVSVPALGIHISEFNGTKDGYLSNINRVNKGTQISLMRDRPLEQQSTKGSSIETEQNLDNTENFNEASRHVSESSNIVPDGSSFPEVNEKHFSSQQSLDKADKLDEMRTRGHLGEMEDIVPGKNAHHEARNSREATDVPDENVTCDVHLEDKAYSQTEESLGKADEISEMLNHRISSGPSVSVEMEDIAPRKNAHHETCTSSEDPDENVTCDVHLEDKTYPLTEESLGEADKISEMLSHGIASEPSVPVTGTNHVHHYASEKKPFFPNGRSAGEATSNNNDGESKLPSVENFKNSESGGTNGEGPFTENGKWLEKNFHEMEPLVEKIGSGFRNNYIVAREKVKDEMDIGFDFMKLRSMNDNTELEWMQDDQLREIVFRVRDNELAGRDPFHSMGSEEKDAFFKGLEKKVEKENENLAAVHEWLHSNIENIDYGADGISLYDPPEKVIPRWKGPPIDKIPEFLSDATVQQHEASSLQKTDESPNHDSKQLSKNSSITKSRPKDKFAKKTSRTVIEASDGSTKHGKKSGKEFWQHTKKLSYGFLESYNAETDPEVKSVMKDIGKDLDRWITEKEIQDAADVMDKIPQRGKEIIEKKLNKVRREMELFGPAAVVSKYSEYAEQKEEDYLWWLDLPYVLCIELYTYEGEEQNVGFYALEMATDFDISPKPNHVIAFEDPGDCKNLCYIIQAHLEMLGSSQAFVVAQIPKEAYRQAKANGFGITVVRKGELQLNIDQPLEEVEELITEIGSKMYHDKLMRERSVDISALMKGVFGISEPSKRKRKKRALKKPRRP